MTGRYDVARDGAVHVLEGLCPTCIFRPGNLMGLRSGRVREMVDEACAADGCIPCHTTIWGDGPPAICRGFFDRYANRSWPLRLAVHLDRVTYDPVPSPPGSAVVADRPEGPVAHAE